MVTLHGKCEEREFLYHIPFSESVHLVGVHIGGFRLSPRSRLLEITVRWHGKARYSDRVPDFREFRWYHGKSIFALIVKIRAFFIAKERLEWPENYLRFMNPIK